MYVQHLWHCEIGHNWKLSIKEKTVTYSVLVVKEESEEKEVWKPDETDVGMENYKKEMHNLMPNNNVFSISYDMNVIEETVISICAN